MADKISCVRVTRASSKRVRAVNSKMSSNDPNLPTLPAKKKRVILGEISSNILSNSGANLQNEPRKTQKIQPVKKAIQSNASVAQGKEAVDLQLATLIGIDTMKLDDIPQMCAPYATGIYHYLRGLEKEPKRRPLGNYIEKVQKDISANMRGVLVDWLVEVSDEYKLESDTLYLAVSYLDRYLSINVVNRRRLQLVGVSSMLIASKYEEINPPQVHDFCYITDNTYTKEEVVSMESDVLKSLNFEMGNPTVKMFLRKFTKVAQENLETMEMQFEFLGCYLAELSLVDYGCIQFLPSLIAAAAIFVAKFTLYPSRHPWDWALQEYSGYLPNQLETCVRILHDLQLGKRCGNLMAIRDKYSHQKFKCVSTLLSSPKIPTSYFMEVDY